MRSVGDLLDLINCDILNVKSNRLGARATSGHESAGKPRRSGTTSKQSPLLFERGPTVSYFLYPGVLELGVCGIVKGEEADHLRDSRRIRPGEQIQLQDRHFKRYLVRIEKIDRRELVVRPLTLLSPPAAPSFRINLFQALVKEKALDFILQKTTELGVAEINLFQSVYSQRLKADAQLERRIARWEKIAVEACKQSDRVNPPAIRFQPSLFEFDQFSSKSSIETLPTLCFTSSELAIPLSQIQLQADAVNILVGPEAGWHPQDLQGFEVKPVHLGPRILRAETAAMTAVGMLQYLQGDLHLAPGPSASSGDFPDPDGD